MLQISFGNHVSKKAKNALNRSFRAGKHHGGWGTTFFTPPKHHSDASALGNGSEGNNFRCYKYVAQIDFGICTMKKAKNAPNRSFSSTVPRPMLATRPRPSPPSRRHPARPRRRAERPDTRCGPEAALTPPTHGATTPNLTDSAVSRPVTTHPARRPGGRSRLLARKCAPRCA